MLNLGHKLLLQLQRAADDFAGDSSEQLSPHPPNKHRMANG